MVKKISSHKTRLVVVFGLYITRRIDFDIPDMIVLNCSYQKLTTNFAPDCCVHEPFDNK